MSNNSLENNQDFIVRRDDLAACETMDNPIGAPGPEQIAVKIDAFAFTANNISYATLGELLKYWNFFPAAEGFGRIPTWGFGDVIASNHEAVAVGERFYGYWPMSTGLILEPGKANKNGFTDVIAHRKGLPAIYNQYARTTEDPLYLAEFENEHMLLSPLFNTSFLLADLLTEADYFGATRVIFSSASSKTAFATASQLQDGKIELIGLTSAGNKSFVEGLGQYSRVLLYDDVASLPKDVKTTYVDYAGKAALTRGLHEHLGDRLVYSLGVGNSHGKLEDMEDLPGAKREQFFAPTQYRKRMKEMGLRVIMEKNVAAWDVFRRKAGDWIKSSRGSGPDAVKKVYLDMLNGRAKADEGYILSM